MPLHNVIPLCNFKYVRDIHSGATFIYDTTSKINKDDSRKTTSNEKSLTEIDKISTKRMYKEVPLIDLSMVKRLLVEETLAININKSMISRRLKPQQRELNKNESLDLEFQAIHEIAFAAAKDFEGVTPHMLDYSQDIKFLKMPELSGMNKGSNLNVEIDRSGKGDIDKIHDKNVGAGASIPLNKSADTLSMINGDPMDVLKCNHGQLMELIPSYEISKYDLNNYIDRINEEEIIKDHTDRFIDRMNLKEIARDKSQKYSTPYAIVDINYKDDTKLCYRDVVAPIDQYDGAVDLDRITERYMNKDKSKRLFYRSMMQDIDRMKEFRFMEPLTIIDLSKDRTKLLNRLHLTNIFKIHGGYLDRLHTTDVFKIHQKYADRIYIKDVFKADSIGLNDVTITPIYKEYQKPILNLSIEDIYKEESRSLNGTLIKEIALPGKNKFIEVTKRWWWLKDTSPKDHLIVPNRDYSNMIDLLNNDNYEYLRYSNHPIDWGKSWGKDANIPPAAISIEIMSELTNIITMIWHKNVQGWLNVSGKEAIQMLMELLYDWYTMDSSNPNHSYYRAYRWIRWEAEKVYFLNTKNGLQAIGILVRNLREYLKWHNFNRVPIWRNPKAMDEERNFNRLAQNGDLMVNINKNKGKRHYYIETQNFEKKNRLIQAKT